MTLDWKALEEAFTFDLAEGEAYLDRKTGGVRWHMDPMITGESEAAEELEAALAAAPERFIEIQRIPPHERYGWMEMFLDSVTDARLREALAEALGGKRPFRQFKDVLAAHPVERERWFAFEAEKQRAAIEAWVRDEQLIVENPPPWSRPRS